MFKKQEENIQQEVQVNQGIVPMTIRMIIQSKNSSYAIYYQNQQIQIVNLITRVNQIKIEASLKLSMILNDDTGWIKAFYFVQNMDNDYIFKLFKLTEQDIDDYKQYYFKVILSTKTYNNSPSYFIQSITKMESNDLIYHYAKIIQNEILQVEPLDWENLKNEPLDIQVEKYMRYYKKANIKQLVQKFKCTIQQLRLILDRLKKQCLIIDCLDPDTFQIV